MTRLRAVATPGRCVAAITVVGLALRLLWLDADSLWFDTAHSGVVALNPTVPEVVRGAAADYQSPLYFVLLHCWLKLGQSDLWLRLPTALIGAAVVPLTYALGRRLSGDWAGVVAALFCAVTSYQVFYSRYPRSYMLLAFLAVAAALTLYEALRRGGRWRWGLHGAFVVLSLYTHPYAFFLLPAVWGWAGLWALRSAPRLLLPLCATAALALAAYLPWLGVSWAQWGGVSRGADAWIEPVTRDTLKTIYDWLWFKTRLEYSLPVDLGLRGGRYLLTAVLLVGWWAGRRRWETWYATGLTAVPIALPIAFSMLAVPLLDARYLVVASPFMALWLGQAVLAAGAVLAAARPALLRRPAGSAAPLLTAVVVAMSLPPLWSLYRDPALASPDQRAANAWVQDRYRAGDLVLHLDYQSYLPALWYDHQRAAIARDVPQPGHPATCSWESLPDAWCDASPYRRTYVNPDLEPVEPALARERHVWLVTLHNHNKPNEAAQAAQRVVQLAPPRFDLRPAAAFLGVQVFELTAR